jgi:hypothetical protein
MVRKNEANNGGYINAGSDKADGRSRCRTMTGKDGLRGYLQHLGLTDQKTFAGLLGRIIPQQIHVKTEGEHVVRLLTIDDVIEEMKAKGIPEAPRPRQRP